MLFPPQMVILAWLMSRSLQLLESSHLLGPASLLHTDTLLNSLRPEAPGSQLVVVTQGSTAYFPRASSQKGTALPFPGSFLHHPRPSSWLLSAGQQARKDFFKRKESSTGGTFSPDGQRVWGGGGWREVWEEGLRSLLIQTKLS